MSIGMRYEGKNASASENVINVIFEAGRGKTENDRQSFEAVTGKPMPRLPGAERKGYRFLGWYTAEGTDGEKICSGDPVTAEEDLHLFARFEKIGKAGTSAENAGPKKKSMLRTQRIAIVVMLAVVVLLAVSIPVLRHFLINVWSYTDSDGTVYTIRQGEDGYALFDPDGNQLERHKASSEADGTVYSEQYYQTVETAGTIVNYFITKIGNQVAIDPETGDHYLFAVVDTDEGEVIGAQTRIMLYPQILQKNLYRIEVHNENGSFAFYTGTTDADSQGIYIEGYEDLVGMAYDPEPYANLCVAGGYPLTILRLDKETVAAHGYEEYGFYDFDGNGEATSLNYFKITERAFDERSGKYLPGRAGVSHTVYLGNATPTGGSRFIKLDGRSTVYVISEQLISPLLGPLSDIVTPLICYPQDSSDFFNLTDFSLWDNKTGECRVAFSFIPMEDRFNTLAQGEAYEFIEPYTYKFKSYSISTDAAFAAATSLYGTHIEEIAVIRPTLEEMAVYGLDEAHAAYAVNFIYNKTDNYGNTVAIPCTLLFSEKKDGQYYVYSDYSQMIVVIKEDYVRFLEYREIDWLRSNYFSDYISYVDEIGLKTKNGEITFDLDNDWTPLLEYTPVTAVDNEGRVILSVTDYTSVIEYDKKTGHLSATLDVTDVIASTEYCYYFNAIDGRLHRYTATVQRETYRYKDATGSTVTKTVITEFTPNNDDKALTADAGLTDFARGQVDPMQEYLDYRMAIGKKESRVTTSSSDYASLDDALGSMYTELDAAVADLDSADFDPSTWNEIRAIYYEAYDKIYEAATKSSYTGEQRVLAMRHILYQALGEIDARVNIVLCARMDLYFDLNYGMIAADTKTGRLYSVEYNDATGNLRVYGTAKDRTGAVTGSVTLLPGDGSDKDAVALKNFRHFYQGILTNAMEAPDLTEEEMEALKAKDDSECLLVMTIKLSDHASAINPNREEDNVRVVTYRFYQYSERRCYLTVDGEGESFILVPAVEKIIRNAYHVLNGETIE